MSFPENLFFLISSLDRPEFGAALSAVFIMTDLLLYMMLLILSLLVMMRVSSAQVLLSRVLLISLLFCTISVAIDYGYYLLLFPIFEETEKIGPFVPKLDIGLLLSSACGSSIIGLLFYLKNKVSSPPPTERNRAPSTTGWTG